MGSGEGLLSSRMSLFGGFDYPVVFPQRPSLTPVVVQAVSEEDNVARFYVVTDLGTMSAGNSSSGTAINDRGQVVDSSEVAGGNNDAFLWTAGARQLPRAEKPCTFFM